MPAALKNLARNAIGTVAPMMWRVSSTPRLVILTYHRVLPAGHPDDALEQPGMIVRPQTLAMHLREIRRHFEIVHLDSWLKDAQEDRPLPARACAITFDDGWRDNHEFALPVLREAGAPATIFVVTGLIGTHRTFWPNRLARMLHALNGAAPPASWPAPLRANLEILVAARVGERLSRVDLDRAIVLCKERFGDEQMLQWTQMAAGAGNAARDLLDWSELHEMACGDLFRIGSHTVSHARFIPSTPADVVEREAADSIHALAERFARVSRVFCYPNGDHADGAVSQVARHYTGAVTTVRGWNDASSDRFRLKRISMHDDVTNTPRRFLSTVAALL